MHDGEISDMLRLFAVRQRTICHIELAVHYSAFGGTPGLRRLLIALLRRNRQCRAL